MKAVLVALVAAVVSVVRSRASLHLEVLALRHQLAVLQNGGRCPRLKPADRVFWVWLSRAWSGWRDVLIFVKPRTVISWQRKRFRDHWTRLSGRGRRVASLGIEEVVTAARSPWQSPYVERMIGSVRRECLDNVVVLGERHLRRILEDHFAHYHRWRCHQSLERDCPEPRPVQPPEVGEVVEVREARGLYRHYERMAA